MDIDKCDGTKVGRWPTWEEQLETAEKETAAARAKIDALIDKYVQELMSVGRRA